MHSIKPAVARVFLHPVLQSPRLHAHLGTGQNVCRAVLVPHSVCIAESAAPCTSRNRSECMPRRSRAAFCRRAPRVSEHASLCVPLRDTVFLAPRTRSQRSPPRRQALRAARQVCHADSPLFRSPRENSSILPAVSRSGVQSPSAGLMCLVTMHSYLIVVDSLTSERFLSSHPALNTEIMGCSVTVCAAGFSDARSFVTFSFASR